MVLDLPTDHPRPPVVSLAHGFVIHSECDRKLLQRHYNLEQRPVALIAHGPYNHYQLATGGQGHRIAPAACCNLLSFGLIRPHKGLEVLISASEALPANEIVQYWLPFVGKTGEGVTQPPTPIHPTRNRHALT